jgi:hypothetical protein
MNSAPFSLATKRCKASNVRRGISDREDIKFTAPQAKPSGKEWQIKGETGTLFTTLSSLFVERVVENIHFAFKWF